MSPQKLAPGRKERGDASSSTVLGHGKLLLFLGLVILEHIQRQKGLRSKRGDNGEEELPEEVGCQGQKTREKSSSVSPTFSPGHRAQVQWPTLRQLAPHVHSQDLGKCIGFLLQCVYIYFN